jgi:hypothetical protein
LEGCHRCDPDTELEGGNKVQRRFEEGDQGGHSPETGGSAIEEGGGLEKENERRGKREE